MGAGPEPTSGKKGSGKRGLLRRALPYGVAVAVLVVVISRHSPERILEVLTEGDAWLLVPWALAASLSSLLLLSLADVLVLARSLGDLSPLTVVRGRAAMSLIAAINYHLGQGGYGFWLSRLTGASLGQTLGIIAYIMLSDLSAVCLVAASALLLTGLEVSHELHGLTLVGAPLFAGSLIVLALIGPALVGWIERRRPLPPKLVQLVAAWARVPAGLYLGSLLLRATHIALSALIWFGAARALAIDAPLDTFLTYLPIIYLVGSLPINVGPFGAVQVVWLALFEPYAEAEQILALQVVFGALLVLSFALRGLPFVSQVTAEIEEGRQSSSSPAPP